MSDPSIALVEFPSIATGLVVGDAMVKAAPLGSIYAGTVHPGKYLVLVSGDTASVEEALAVARDLRGDSMIDSVFLADVHPDVAAAIVGEMGEFAGDALGIVETRTVAGVIDGADGGVKAARVELASIRLADGLGGKGYALFTGVIGEVEAAMEAAADRVGEHGELVGREIIPQLHVEMAHNLRADLRFGARVVMRAQEA